MTRGRCWQTVLVAAGIFALMYALNYLMPLHRDDYDYSMIWQTGRHIASLSDVMESLQRHYLLHGGRMAAFFFLDVFLLLGKGIFDVANALMFLVFIVLLTIHARRDGRFWQEPGIFAAMGILAWLSFPHFGEVAVWKCGAAVYLWTGAIVALFLVPYNLHCKTMDQGDTPARHWLIAPMFALGVLAGWSVENLAVTVFVLAAGISWQAKRKGDLPLWMPAGTFGALAGLVLLVAAPGNFVRYDAQGSGKGILVHIGNQFAGNGEMALYLLPVILLLIAAGRIYRLHLAAGRGMCAAREEVSPRLFGWGRILCLLLIALLVVSYFHGGFFAHALRDFLVAHVLAPLGIDKPRTVEHFANVMAGFEEMAIYWLAIFFFYSLLKRALGFSHEMLASARTVPWRSVLHAFPAARYAAFLIALALFNNFVMIAAPTFPARATFSSVAMILIGACAVLRDPVVRDCLWNRAKKTLLAASLAIGIFTMTAAFFITAAMQQENDVRLAIVKQAAENGEEIAYMKPILLKNRALRHVFFVDFDNGVTKDGLCQYYGIKDIRVER